VPLKIVQTASTSAGGSRDLAPQSTLGSASARSASQTSSTASVTVSRRKRDSGRRPSAWELQIRASAVCGSVGARSMDWFQVGLMSVNGEFVHEPCSRTRARSTPPNGGWPQVSEARRGGNEGGEVRGCGVHGRRGCPAALAPAAGQGLFRCAHPPRACAECVPPIVCPDADISRLAGRALFFSAPGALVLRSTAHGNAPRSSAAVGQRQWLSAHRRRQHTARFVSSSEPAEVWCLRARAQHTTLLSASACWLEILMCLCGGRRPSWTGS
jgi:hypothetical protein